MHRPSADDYNPPLRWRDHAWRTALVVVLSTILWWGSAPDQWHGARPLFWLDLSLGFAALGLTFFRRRWPFAVAVVTNLMGAVSVTANGSSILATASLATRRIPAQIVIVGLMSMAASATIPLVQPGPASAPLWIDFALGLLFTIAMIACGMFIGSRRELLWTLRDRADRAESEQGLRIEQAQLNERTRIAREMHDVMAHKISLVSMHAGALSYRNDLTPEETHRTAELIQTKSNEALDDLHHVLGVLRDGKVGDIRETPQPTFRDVPALILESEGAGMRIQLKNQISAVEQLPDQVGRTAYRIVQEGLTNVRKHAPGVAAAVELTGSPSEGVLIKIRNPARSPRRVDGVHPLGAGLGLVGLSERTKLAGGHLTTRREGGFFELTGWLPWDR